MASNSFGDIFRFTSWGESHGEAIGCVVDGVPSGIDLSEDYIQQFLDKRKPGEYKFSSARKEADKVRLLSGVFNGKTTGAPISAIIWNQDHQSGDYEKIKDIYRPGHGDYVYDKKYQNRDYRGGGRASARETAARVIAGAIAQKIIPDNIKFSSIITQIGNIPVVEKDFAYARSNPLRCPDKNIFGLWEKLLEDSVNSGDSLGAIVEVRVANVGIGIGEPIYKKLNAKIAEAVLSVNSVKGIDFGLGFDGVTVNGSKYHDQMSNNTYTSNREGGIIAGISNGQDIIFRYVTKPPSSIKKLRKTIDKNGQDVDVTVEGRHDPITAIRAIVVVEAMIACVLADLYLHSRALEL